MSSDEGAKAAPADHGGKPADHGGKPAAVAAAVKKPSGKAAAVKAQSGKPADHGGKPAASKELAGNEAPAES